MESKGMLLTLIPDPPPWKIFWYAAGAVNRAGRPYGRWCAPSSDTTLPPHAVDEESGPQRLLKAAADGELQPGFSIDLLCLLQKRISCGTSATTFSPDAACTRAQAVTFLWRAVGSPAPKSSVNPFADVPASAYYYDAVLWAVAEGVTAGTSATTFSPDASCTRAQIVTFLYRAYAD